MSDTTPFLEIRPRKTYNPQPQVAVLVITSALLRPGLHILLLHMSMNTCVQTDVYIDVFLAQGMLPGYGKTGAGTVISHPEKRMVFDYQSRFLFLIFVFLFCFWFWFWFIFAGCLFICHTVGYRVSGRLVCGLGSKE